MAILNNVSNQKQELRKLYRNKRRLMHKSTKMIMDDNIYLNLLSLEAYISSEKVFIYLSKRQEVDTWKILNYSINHQKKIFVPKCNDREGGMSFYLIKSVRDLELGLYGIYEPIVSRSKISNEFCNSICIVPGLCFDVHGYRVGYGRGFYDRFLKQFTGIKVGLCYSSCIEKQIDHEEFDQRMDVIVTDKNAIFLS